MRSKRSIRINVSYVLSLVVALSLLVWWIVYVLQSAATINQFAGRLGGGGTTSHWLVLGLGCALFVMLIAGLTFQPTVHVHYGEKVMAVRDGLPKFKDFPKEFGGSGEMLPE